MEQTLKGTIIYGDEFEPVDGYITIENGIIKSVEESTAATDAIIAPCFVNAHTHIGDSVIKDPPYLPLEELVQPPHGLKHRILRDLTRQPCRLDEGEYSRGGMPALESHYRVGTAAC